MKIFYNLIAPFCLGFGLTGVYGGYGLIIAIGFLGYYYKMMDEINQVGDF